MANETVWIISIVIIIIIIGLIVWAIIDSNSRNKKKNANLETDTNRIPNKGNLNDSCSTDDNCKHNLACDQGICKIKLGDECTNINDCVSAATACHSRVCISTPLPNIGENCSDDLPCTSGNCENGFCRASIGETCVDDTHCPVNSGGCRIGIDGSPRCVGSPANLGEPCNLIDKMCMSQLFCDNGNCKLTAGSKCDPNDDQCRGGYVCSKSENDTFNCQVDTRKPIGEVCESHTECSSGRCGKSSLLVSKGAEVKEKHSFSDRKLIDVIEEGCNMLMLFEDGDILRRIKTDSSSKIETIKNNIKIKRFALLGGLGQGQQGFLNLYGLNNNKLYQLNEDKSDRNNWKWVLVDWAPDNITYISHTYDGNHIWIQYRMQHPPKNLPIVHNPRIPPQGDPQMNRILERRLHRRNLNQSGNIREIGGLYQLLDKNKQPSLVTEAVMPEGWIRVYGRDDISYLEVDTINNRAIRFPKGDMISNYHVGTLLPNSDIFKLGLTNQKEIKDVRFLPLNMEGKVFLISNRLCQSN